MGKVKKSAGSKHDGSISSGFKEYINKLSTVSLAELPVHLASLSKRWPYPRGDLYHWINPLDRFDDILQNFNNRYALNLGPQTIPFGVAQLLEGSPDVDEKRLRQLGYGPEGDRELIESILAFTKLLLEKCGNRNLYNSADRLNDILNTTSLPLLHSTLRLALCLAQRHREKSRNSPLPTPFSHYSFDVEKLQKLAAPVSSLETLSRKTEPTSPVKSTKGKDKSSQTARARQNLPAANPNDFRSLLKQTPTLDGLRKAVRKPSLTEKDWQCWANIRIPCPVVDSHKDASSEVPVTSNAAPLTPTPFRRRPSTTGSRLSKLSFSEDQNNLNTAPATGSEHTVPVPRVFELSYSDLEGASIEEILKKSLLEVPQAQQYELLHKLRNAYALQSSGTRRLFLENRLLAMANLACVLYDGTFGQKVFGHDQDPARRQRLIQSTISLLRDGGKEQLYVPLSTQSSAMELLGALARQKLTSSDVFSALGVSSSHGVLLALTQKGLADLAHDADATDNPEGDEWREHVFGMLKTTLEATAHFSRSSDAFASSSIISAYVEGLKINTGKALRVQLKILEFCKSFFHHVKDGLSALSTNKAFEAACQSFDHLVNSSIDLTTSGSGFPDAFRTPSTDYQIPYLHQLVIRSILDLINDVSGHQGPHADRVLRELIDTQLLLVGFRTVIDNGKSFGAHTWSEVVRCISGFLHHEPTSYTVISEAGLSRSILQSVTINDIPNAVRPSVASTQPDDASSPAAADTMNQDAADMNGGVLPTPSSVSKTISAEPQRLPQGILPSTEVIQHLSQAFGALCLTNAGFDLFKSSGALQKFFEIFESPDHVKAMKDGHVLSLLGSTFDELVRHHPNLKPMVMSAVVIMIARVRNICRNKTWEIGAGPKLWDPKRGLNNSVCGGPQSLLFEVTQEQGIDQPGLQRIALPDGNLLELSDAINLPPDADTMVPREKDDDGLGVMDYLMPAMSFLATFFENPSLCTSFMEGGGTDFILDLVTIPSLPPNDHAFGPNSTLYELANIVHSMAETKPHIVLPELLSRALTACKELQDFADHQPRDSECYFKSLVTFEPKLADAMDLDEKTSDFVSENGTKLVRCLTAVQSLMQVLADVFQGPVYSSRTSQSSPFAQVNLADMYADLCQALGKISAACIREELAILRQIPDTWLTATRPGDFLTGNDDINSILSLKATETSQNQESLDTPSTSTGLNFPGATNGQTEIKDSGTTGLSLAQERNTAAFKNVETLRYLLLEVPSSITQFFSMLSFGFSNKRKDQYQKQSVTMVGKAMANALVTQLKPYFFEHPSRFTTSRVFLQSQFAYLAVVLANIKQTLLGPTPSSDHDQQCMLFVTLAFKEIGGFELLTSIGVAFFDQLKTCETSEEVLQTMTSANSGLKISLEVLESLTSAKCVIEAPQSTTFKNPDPSKPFYFVPSQFLLELRMLSLPLTRMIWDSDYVYQASQAVVESLVSIFKNVLNGDSEHDAYKTAESRPQITPPPYKKFPISAGEVHSLQAKGFKEDLAREALFRCHNNENQAHEYCRATSRTSRRRRCPIPPSELESAVENGAEAASESPSIPLSETIPRSPTPEILSGGFEEAPDEEFELTHGNDDDEDATEGSPSRDMSISSILNDDVSRAAQRAVNQATLDTNGTPRATVTSPVITVQSMNAERDSIRQDLVERCLNLLGNQGGITFELSDLIMSSAKRLSDEAANNYRQDSSALAIQCLLSLQEDQITEAHGKKTAATAHLVALLIQDKDFYDKSESLLKEVFNSLTDFIKVPQPIPGQTTPDSFPWIGSILLIVERMLCNDSEPPKVTWRMPAEEEESAPAVYHDNTVVSPEGKKHLFEAVLGVLPAVGKDRSLALSLARVLVILTRRRELSILLAEKRNLQRLAVMVKQLAGGFDERLQSSIMIILRHIVEDEDTIRQIMRSEIVAYMTGRTSRQIETTTYIRDLYALILRSPDIFVEITNEKVKLYHFDSSSRPQQLVLRTQTAAHVSKDEADPSESAQPNAVDPQPKESVEGGDAAKAAIEAKPPVVERPDGLIHFLLSELLNYKDVEDKEVSTLKDNSATDHTATSQFSESAVSPETPQAAVSTNVSGSKPVKVPFKIEDHPHYSYRCFILQCLTELLHCYNRTKIEFINFSRKADPLAATPSKPRSGILNYILNALVTTGSVDMEDSGPNRKTLTTASWATNVIVALCSKTGEMGLSSSMQRYSTHSHIDDKDDEPDLAFVRRFVLEHGIKAFKDITASSDPPQTRYPRMMGLAELFNKLIAKATGPEGSAGSHNNSYKVLSRMMFEKNLISVLTSALAEVDLTNPGAKRVIKYILRPLNELTNTAQHLSMNSPTPITSALGSTEEDVISSASSSVSEIDDEREETPDFFRNSTLGMMEPHRQDQSSSETDDEGDEEELYDEGYEDEMEYDDMAGAGANDGEVVSDEEIEEQMNGSGPVEGLPGDVPVDIELVMDDGNHMDVDSQDDDEDEDEDDEDDDDEDDSDDDDDEEDDGDSFMIEGDDAILDGEINGDNENDSLDDNDPEGSGDWQDEDDGEEEIDFGEDLQGRSVGAMENIPTGLPEGRSGQGPLNALLRVLDEEAHDEYLAEVNTDHRDDPMSGDMPIAADEDEEDDDDEDDDEEADLDEQADIVYDQFNDMLDGNDDMLDRDDQWAWDEPPPWLRRHRHVRGAGHMPNFLGRHIRPGTDIHQLMTRPQRSHQAPPPGRGAGDDGTNPLLQRQGSGSTPPRRTAGPPIAFSSGFDASFPGLFPPTMPGTLTGGPGLVVAAGDGGPFGGHGGMLDHLVHMIQQHRNFRHGGRLEVNLDGPPAELREILSGGPVTIPMPRSARDDPFRSVSFIPAMTQTRWVEEARLLFGNTWPQVIQRIINPLLAAMTPSAKKEQAERKKRAEEERKREEEERLERERLEKEAAEAARLREEEEQREAAAKAAAEAEAAAASAAAAQAEGRSLTEDEGVGRDEPMEDVQATGETPAAEAADIDAVTEEAPANRIFTTIRGQQLDITGMSIDAEYLEALPEELREEVIMQQYTAQREQAQEQGGNAAEGIDPDFLNALPEDLREEVRQAEAHATRRRERDAVRREAQQAGGPAQAEDMDPDSFFATLDPALRRAILAEQPPEVLERLDPRHAAEGRAHARHLFRYQGLPVGADPRGDRAGRDQTHRDTKRQIVQMVDKAGVATLLRLMFLPQQGSMRSNLQFILRNVCGNRQTRFEVITLFLLILKEGSTDVSAIERSLATLSLRARASASQKTPQPLKRTLSLQPGRSGISEEMTPLMIIQQCLDALKYLSRHDNHVKSIFLREIDPTANSKSKSSRKGKGKENWGTKYPLNDLISLLDRKLIMDNSTCLQSCAELLSAVTSPLILLSKEEKPQPASSSFENTSSTEAQEGSESQTVRPSTETSAGTFEAVAESSVEDLSMNEAGAHAAAPATEALTADSVEAQAEDEDQKMRKPFDPPIVPDHNLQLVVSILVAQECNNITFTTTLDSIRSLSYLPGASSVFREELINQAQTLSRTISSDLDELLPLIRDATSGTDLQSIVASKFSPAGSDQVKLLRILTALDYLYDPERADNQDKTAEDTTRTKSVLNSSYESLQLGPLWSKLSDCLAAIREKENMLSFATILLPLIESLMVVCKNTSLKDAPLARQIREQSVTSPVQDSPRDLEELFFNFTTEHRKILNEIVRQNPKLMQGTGNFALLVKNPKVLEFDNKRSYFTKQTQSRQRNQRHPQPPLQLSVRRSEVFLDSFKSLYFKTAEEMKYGKLSVRFHNEEGVDAGGVSREWWSTLARGMFDPNYALWQPVASDKTTFHPSSLSGVNDEHLMFFKFIGRIIGKAVHEGRVLDCHFSRPVYKKILGRPINIKDMESLDIDYYKSLMWILENDITDIISEDFSVVTEVFGEERVVDLIPDGRNIPVTEENKAEYVQKLVEHRLIGSVKDQLDNFVEGFHNIVPSDLVSIFNESELELLISGLPEINVDDWKANTEYHSYSAASQQIQWFWRAVKSFTEPEKAALLQFITGTSKVPLNGFKELEGMHGITRCSIHRDPSKDRLPSSHTCFNQLDLPEYDSYESLKKALLTACEMGGNYFGFA